MNCHEARLYLSAHLDEELDLVRDAEIVAHLNVCPACADAALAHVARRGLIRDKSIRHPAPAGLRASILGALPVAKSARTLRFNVRRVWPWVLPLAAGFAVMGVGGYAWGTRQERSRDFVAALTSSHVRALMSEHTVDVASTDRHTVKPWFAGKLDFTPPVFDLASDGFPLVGGRLDYLAGQTVAVLVYGRRKHLIDVYILPTGTGTTLSDTTHSGFNLEEWTDGENRCVAVSDLAANELREFSRLLQTAMR